MRVPLCRPKQTAELCEIGWRVLRKEPCQERRVVKAVDEVKTGQPPEEFRRAAAGKDAHAIQERGSAVRKTGEDQGGTDQIIFRLPADRIAKVNKAADLPAVSRGCKDIMFCVQIVDGARASPRRVREGRQAGQVHPAIADPPRRRRCAGQCFKLLFKKSSQDGVGCQSCAGLLVDSARPSPVCRAMARFPQASDMAKPIQRFAVHQERIR